MPFEGMGLSRRRRNWGWPLGFIKPEECIAILAWLALVLLLMEIMVDLTSPAA